MSEEPRQPAPSGSGSGGGGGGGGGKSMSRKNFLQGTVGAGVYKHLTKNRVLLTERLGLELVVRKIVARDWRVKTWSSPWGKKTIRSLSRSWKIR